MDNNNQQTIKVNLHGTEKEAKIVKISEITKLDVRPTRHQGSNSRSRSKSKGPASKPSKFDTYNKATHSNSQNNVTLWNKFK